MKNKIVSIYLYNTLTRKKELFKPLRDGHVSMYHCGPTVYDFAHIGNMRSYIFADTLRRVFEYGGYNIKQVINITDVGHLISNEDEGVDRVEEAARLKKQSTHEIVEYYSKAFFADLKRLNIKTKETIFPEASKHITEQVALLAELERRKFTYRTNDGIYFDTSKIPTYGALGNIHAKNLKEGARVKWNPEKKHITDFALWKFSNPHESESNLHKYVLMKRQQEWDSPWGRGFPGWHLECSAMSMIYLGETIDIHTGGVDHIPVHHTNEIAQSEAATGKPFVNYWLHNEFIIVDGQKMAKSSGNFITINDIIKKGFNPLSYRYWLLQGHYRTPLNFTWEALQGAENALSKLYEHYFELSHEKGKIENTYEADFIKAVSDDLDFPKAIAIMWRLVKDEQVDNRDKKETLFAFDAVLGIGISAVRATEIQEKILLLIKKREMARKQGDWKEADSIREEVRKHGFDIKDTPQGPRTLPVF